ncbi:hypothetical protein ACFL0M_00370 [Thermodesulfobacteriota bacterium]
MQSDHKVTSLRPRNEIEIGLFRRPDEAPCFAEGTYGFHMVHDAARKWRPLKWIPDGKPYSCI